MSEPEIQNSICEYLELRGHFFWRSNNIPVYDPTRKCYRKMPKYAMNGVPDIIVVGKEGSFIGLEVKQPKRYLSKDQKAFKEICESKGGRYHLVRSIDDVQNIGL